MCTNTSFCILFGVLDISENGTRRTRKVPRFLSQRLQSAPVAPPAKLQQVRINKELSFKVHAVRETLVHAVRNPQMFHLNDRIFSCI